MSRHTTFQWVADPTIQQARALARHVGAARFAFNQGLRLHLNAREASKNAAAPGLARDGDAVKVPWTGFDLINAFNTWKRSEDAGRRFVAAAGVAEVEVTGLAWRTEVSAQVFEEAVVDLGKALRAWTDSRRGKRAGRPVGHPRFKKKNHERGSFRMRNRISKTRAGARSTIRIGENGPRSVTLPGIGAITVHDDTRRLRRMLNMGRARILFATVTRRGGRWRISLNVEAADLHPAARHPRRDDADHTGWVGVDRGLHTPVVVALANGNQTLRVAEAPKALRTAQPATRRLQKAVSRKVKGSQDRRAAVRRLARHHERVRARRHHFLHQVSNALVKTHDRLVIEDLNITGMLANRHLAAAISDAAWGELARQITYKTVWSGGQVLTADRWFPSSKTCSACGNVNQALALADRVFTCDCGHSIDRDLNAATNLATWGEKHHSQVLDPEARGQVNNAHRPDGSGPRTRADETSRDDVGTLTASAA